MDFVLCLFAHTAEGEAALGEFRTAGIAQGAIQVIGDLGPPAGEPGAEHHVTFDALHVPAADRTLLMDTIREGGVVLAVDAGVVDVGFAERVAGVHHALRVLHTSSASRNPSHNAAR